MMRMRTKTSELTAVKGSPTGGEKQLEVRPGGMLVQRRDPDEELTRIPPPTIRVRVKFGSIYHEMIISSTATFGELKKMLSGPTGLHHEEQKLIYKDKERASKTFLDAVGVKDKSKMVVLDDPVSRERRLIEARKTAKIEKATKTISDISLEVNRLAGQVSAVESVISKGGKVADKTVLNLIELFMNQLLRLDEIKVDGDLNQHKKKQVEKVQRYVETLDILKLKNTTTENKANEINPVAKPTSQPRPNQTHSDQRLFKPPAAVVASQQTEASSKKTSGGVVVTTQWETFEPLPTIFGAPPTSTSTTSGTIQQHSFNWDLLLK